MDKRAHNSQPDWFSPPGATMHAVMKNRAICLDDLSEFLGWKTSDTKQLVDGFRSIDQEIAHKLSEFFGGSKDFWLKRQSDFDDDLRRCMEAIDHEQAEQLVARLPLSDMRKFGWIPKKGSKLQSILQFFDVQGLSHWKRRYAAQASAVAFRQSETLAIDLDSTLVWLRQAERKAYKIRTAEWNKKLLVESLPELRTLVKKKKPARFFPELQKICARAGVALVYVPTPKGCRASGATQFLSTSKALIVMSFRYRSDDHFWFTFFHEIGHLILHDERALFVEDESCVTMKEEQEANAFSRNVLLPDEQHTDMLEFSQNAKSIIKFAVKVNLTPGVIVGQMQHADIIRNNQMNSLKRRYSAEELEAIR